MRIWLTGDEWPRGPEKYRFPIEQMLLTLFPGERPEYPENPPGLPTGERGVILTLRRDGPEAEISALVRLGDRCETGAARFPSHKLDEPGERVYHTVSHTLKQAFYQAGTALLGHGLPWGALTGVRPVKLPTKAMLAGKTRPEAEEELQKIYHVDRARAKLAAECAQAALDVRTGLARGGMALYVGVPFCPSRCAYCSFISSDVKGALALVEPYVDALCREVRLAGDLLREKNLHISCAYMGGGTPTTLSAKQLDRVLGAVKTCLPMERCAEFTVEAGRPDTITADKLEVLKMYGVCRVSVNPQTMEDDVLRAIGRAHTAGQTAQAMELVKKYFGGIVNMDLIAGLPGDTAGGFKRTLDRVLAMGPDNITVHTLALKKGSRLTEENGTLCPAETVEQMLAMASGRLRGSGYEPYYLYRQKYMSGSFENVGWCGPGTACVYNIVMMEELQSVLSLGAGGITKLVDPENGRIIRLNNPKYAKEYLESWEKVSANKRTAVDFQAELARRTVVPFS